MISTGSGGGGGGDLATVCLEGCRTMMAGKTTVDWGMVAEVTEAAAAWEAVCCLKMLSSGGGDKSVVVPACTVAFGGAITAE